MIATTRTITDLLAANAPVAAGVSGGKDSLAMGVALDAYLSSIGHTGPRLFIHADLGRVEWASSLPDCEALAQTLGWELVVVRRAAGDLMDRWLVRWRNNVERYTNLSCVRLILPWSTPAMRFCTSELKTAPICRELVRRFPGQTILSASGLRREESPSRAKKLVSQPQNKLTSVTHATTGYDWHPIIDWTVAEVWAALASRGIRIPAPYVVFGSSRVSCRFCIMGSQGDLRASAGCADNADLYREMVDLEIVSTFSFQSNTWLGDVAPHLLTEAQRTGLARAKQRADKREWIEMRIPKHLLYSKGWPTVMPSLLEARNLGRVRQEIGDLLEITVKYTDALSVLGRYEELMDARPTTFERPTVQTAMEIC